jgi:hypothetical protein
MSERKVQSSRLEITIEAGEEFFFVSSEHAVVGGRGMFVRSVQLPVGTPVVIQVCKKKEAVSTLGVVCANYPTLGLAIEFKDKTGRAARQLASLLAA